MSIGKTSNVLYDQDTDIFTLTHGTSDEVGKVIFDIDVTTDYHLIYSTRITASSGSNGYFDARIGDYTDAVSICVYHDQSGGDLYIHHNGYELSNVPLPGFEFGKLQEMEIISKNNSMFIMYEGAYVIDVDFGESNVAFTNGWLEYTACNLEGCSHTLGIFTYEPHFVVNEDTYFNKSVSAKEYFGITLDQVEGCYWSNMDVENNINMITLGNIGIGTTAPAYSLHVNGTIYGSNYVNINYNDLINKPTIPSGQVNADWNATSGAAQILNKPTIPSLFDGANYTVNNAWFREQGDNAHVKTYGNTRQMAFRTDGTTEYATGVGGYPFAWMYGGDAAVDRLMLMDTNGYIWTQSYGWLHDYFVPQSTLFSAGGVGTYALLGTTARALRSQGAQVAGSSLRQCNVFGATGGLGLRNVAAAGTWILIGQTGYFASGTTYTSDVTTYGTNGALWYRLV